MVYVKQETELSVEDEQLSDTEAVRRLIEEEMGSDSFAERSYIIAGIQCDWRRCMRKAVQVGERLDTYASAEDVLVAGAVLILEDAMSALSDQFVDVEVNDEEFIKRRTCNLTGGSISGVSWRKQEVIEAFCVDKQDGLTDPWLVAYDDAELLNDPYIPTSIHYEMRTIWVNNRFRGRKKQREEEIIRALKTISEIEYGGKAP